MPPARRNERGLVIPNKEIPTTLGAKMAPALRVAAKKTPLVVHLEPLNSLLAPKLALFLVTTVATLLVLTGPSTKRIQ